MLSLKHIFKIHFLIYVISFVSLALFRSNWIHVQFALLFIHTATLFIWSYADRSNHIGVDVRNVQPDLYIVLSITLSTQHAYSGADGLNMAKTREYK